MTNQSKTSPRIQALLTCRELAKLYSTTPMTVTRWVSEQGCPVARIRPYLFDAPAVAQWREAKALAAVQPCTEGGVQ